MPRRFTSRRPDLRRCKSSHAMSSSASLARVISSERRYRCVGDIPQSLPDSDNLTIRTLYTTSDFYRRAEDIGVTAVT
jgi:hypothetical protein